jgi:hypothetical protein
MRKPAYLSPSQIGLWGANREEYYLQHLSEVRAPKLPQINYMSLGSAFDAYAKSTMFETLFGKTDPRFEFTTLFEEQVEEHNRDWALEHGKYVYDCYRVCGAYDDLLDLLKQSKHAPQFEFKITGTIENVPLLGKPDLRFVHPSGAHVILDWKVNGFCSRSPTSPCKNYRLIRDSWGPETAKPTRGGNGPHKNYRPLVWKGVEIHSGWLEESNADWADQLAIYSWMLGEAVGDENVVVCIDQIVAKPHEPRPLLRIANHRARISKVHQENLIRRVKECWEAITTDHIFPDMTIEESQERCKLLDQCAMNLQLDDPMAQYINSITREQRSFKR